MLTAKITSAIVASATATHGLVTSEANLSKSYVANYANGTGANQAQAMFTDSRSIAGSGTDNLDLSGTLVDAAGVTLALTGVKEIVIANTSLNQIRVGKKITNGFAGPFDQTAGSLGLIVEAGGVLRLSNPSAAGWTVTAATGDLLSIENLGATASTYDVIVIGK